MIWLLLACATAPEGPVHSAPTTPTALADTRPIDARALADVKDALVVDVRERDDYDHGHVPGAIAMPLNNMTPHDPRVANWPKERPLYVTGYADPDTDKAAAAFAGAGYHVVELKGGMETWLAGGFPLQTDP